MSNAATDVGTADEASPQVELHAENDGVTGASTPDHDKALIPWDQAVAVARRIIEPCACPRRHQLRAAVRWQTDTQTGGGSGSGTRSRRAM